MCVRVRVRVRVRVCVCVCSYVDVNHGLTVHSLDPEILNTHYILTGGPIHHSLFRLYKQQENMFHYCLEEDSRDYSLVFNTNYWLPWPGLGKVTHLIRNVIVLFMLSDYAPAFYKI